MNPDLITYQRFIVYKPLTANNDTELRRLGDMLELKRVSVDVASLGEEDWWHNKYPGRDVNMARECWQVRKDIHTGEVEYVAALLVADWTGVALIFLAAANESKVNLPLK